MKSLNEKLAVEVMGATVTQCGQMYWHDRPIFDGHHHVLASLWNPTQDLNQLRECYLALSEEEKAFVQIKFAVPFNDLTNKWPSDRDNLFAIFEHPELVAQAILKAKGVEL